MSRVAQRITDVEGLLSGAARGGDAGPSWLHAFRQQSRESFLSLGLPTTRHEDWKYTDISRLTTESFAAVPVRPPLVDAKALPLPLGGTRLVFVNGCLIPGLGTASDLPTGVYVGSFDQAVERIPDTVRTHLGELADLSAESFVALNGAHLNAGVVVAIENGVQVEGPIELLFVATDGNRTAVHPRNLIIVGAGARASIVERYLGTGTELTFSNSVTEIDLEEGGAVHHVRVQDESMAAIHVGSVWVRQRAATHFASAAISLGAALSRTEIRAFIDGPGAVCELDGLYLAQGSQHVDHQTFIDHRVPRGTSRELYKGVLDDSATGVFGGKVMVREDAQQSDAQQMNKNLLLSDRATVDTKPQLEIFADDVKCSHGAAIGRLDETAMFYLRSRGIASTAARRMLIRAFADEMVERITCPELRADLERRIAARLDVHAAEKGRAA